MKKQIIAIHGGDSFDSYEKYLDSLKNGEVSLENFLPKNDWKRNLPSILGDEYQVLMPNMPNAQNARYEEWKIWFERMFPFIQDGVIFIGHSQGGIFLAKYLSENKFPKKISSLFLVAAPHTNTPEIGDFALDQDLSGIAAQCGNIHLYQSKDDPIVPFSDVELYQKDLPQAKVHIFEDRQHFNQENFPEILEEIRK